MRLLAGMTLFSLLSLPYVAQFPSIAHLNFGIPAKGTTYKWLYATWGMGACVGALSIGTVLAQVDKRRLIRPFFLGFAASMTVFALVRSVTPAFPVGFLLGFFYFGLATAMLTVLQQNLRSSERARVMSLWFMAFGGTVGIGGLIFGPVIDVLGSRPVLLISAASALALSWWCDVARRPVSTLADEDVAIVADDRRSQSLEAGRTAGLDEHGITAGE
jgi:predicted MFS family arabinose efflux permease